jgi:hypothetical protein
MKVGSTVIGGTVAYDSVNKRAVVTPSAQMAAGAGYTVTVKGGTNGVSDMAGNRMAANNAFSFTTAAPTGPILGHNQVGALLDNGDMNYMNGSVFMTGASGMTPTRAYVYMTSVQAAPNNQYQITIYNDAGGVPGTLVASTASGTLTANSWNSMPISATLTPNTQYWLMYNTNGDNNVRYDPDVTGAGGWGASGQPFGTWPQDFGGIVQTDLKISIYVQ